ncbi:hypothetical protein SteCoe_24243 [Stentor coeruleus]|uniref:HAUS augmin-like complex subunit 3 N-terminal domain-containing protein n=1 Tax=Stentor coeruleus TaxID=5963 RepID=A0A1R2BI17_9CILI|nr:hypothetical protein SteCoe_24243 [Stentor coeruleus]
MSGKDLYEKLLSKGYAAYMTQKSLSEALKPSEKSLDWLFAFPKIKKLLTWILYELPPDQFFSFSEMLDFEKLSSILPYDEINEISDLITPEIYENSLLSDLEDNIKEELTRIVREQEKDIKKLNEDIENPIEDDIDPGCLEAMIQKEDELLEKEVLRHLNSLAEICPVVSLSSVQQFAKLDEEINQYITNYSKTIDLSLNAIDGSLFQQCLRSDRASEFTNLCQEKKKLEVMGINCQKQLLLANCASEKYKAALKAFESLMIKDGKPNKLLNPHILISSNNTESENISNTIKDKIHNIDKTTQEIHEICTESIEFQNLDLLMKKEEFLHIKSLEINKFIENFRKVSLLALSSIIHEQDEIQQEYDRLYQVQGLFEELTSAMEFRINSYPKLKLKCESLNEDRKTIDDRDKFLKDLWEALNGEQKRSLNFEDILGKIEGLTRAYQDKQEKKKDANERLYEDIRKRIKECNEVLEVIQNQVFTDETERQCKETRGDIERIDESLGKALKKFEDIQRETYISPGGNSERDVFVQYLLNAEPDFFKECDLIS